MSDAPLRRFVAVRLVTQDAVALARFYADALGAALLGVDRGKDACERTGLTIGAQRLDLDRFDAPGAPYPLDVAADDLRFQHFAFVVADIGPVHRQALACGAGTISRGGPIALPASAGGVTAVKLRDPEGHPFELLQFPPGGAPRWDRTTANDRGVLGIDHSAITVRDAQASAVFYTRHGLEVEGAGVNRGPTQAALDGLEAPVVDVVPLRPAAPGPHLELLGYRGERRPARPTDARDVVATRIVWASDRDDRLVDPDGHLHQLVRDAPALSW